jgi:hypothetical protein
MGTGGAPNTTPWHKTRLERSSAMLRVRNLVIGTSRRDEPRACTLQHDRVPNIETATRIVTVEPETVVTFAALCANAETTAALPASFSVLRLDSFRLWGKPVVEFLFVPFVILCQPCEKRATKFKGLYQFITLQHKSKYQ